MLTWDLCYFFVLGKLNKRAATPVGFYQAQLLAKKINKIKQFNKLTNKKTSKIKKNDQINKNRNKNKKTLFSNLIDTDFICVSKNLQLFSYHGGGGGVLTYVRHPGTFRSNGSVFHEKSLAMGPIFYKHIPRHGSVFSNFPNFLFFCLPCEHPKILKNGSLF